MTVISDSDSDSDSDSVESTFIFQGGRKGQGKVGL
jgi:hypothetical protein